MLTCGQFSCLPADGPYKWDLGLGNQIQDCCSQGEFHMEHVHYIHPFFIITLLSFLPSCTELLMELWMILDGEVSALFHPQDFWRVPPPLLVSLKYALLAIG